MSEEKRSPNSQNDLALKSMDSAELVNKDESQNKKGTVRFKIDVECSKDFAENVLREYFSVFRATKENKAQNRTDIRYHLRPVVRTPYQLPATTNRSGQSRSENVGESVNWRRKISISILLILLMSILAVAGNNYLKYYKKQSSERARHDVEEMNSHLYEAILAQNLNHLLDKLDELTAIPRMGNAFPEITSMSAIARFKRGPEPTEKARAAIEFLWRVKHIFDSWTKRPHDLATELKPTEKDIALFLAVWEDTRILLEKLETAKQNPVEFLTAGHDLKGM